MNIQEKDILNELSENRVLSQRELADRTGHSLGIINKSINHLIKEEYIDKTYRLTEKAEEVMKDGNPKNAIILAAGYGMRMVPINTETPKGLLEVRGEVLIERMIRQLHEAGVQSIQIIVGFMKERYEYLIDEFNVELIVNEEYSMKNNLHSLKLAVDSIDNSYIIPCDVWCEENPFRAHELYSWYMVNDEADMESAVKVNRKMELVTGTNFEDGNGMIGISYIHTNEAEIVRENIKRLAADPKQDASFWEEALYQKNKMITAARVVPASKVVEINTYEQLRELDSDSDHLKSDAIRLLTEVFKVDPKEITEITVLKKGMTNRSFLFSCKGKRYIMRIPGEGTEFLINREQEAAVYNTINGHKICDNIVYINPKNGYKITEFMEGARTCDAEDDHDVEVCMQYLRKFHERGFQVDHEFNIFEKIEFYESLWEGKPSVYKDYEKTKKNALSLKEYIDAHAAKRVLTHIDAVADNYLFVKDIDGNDVIRLIDWEYSGMQDPHVDIAMFAIYSLYRREQVDRLIDLYFTEGCPKETRIKIYCYIAVCGLLWSNWCEYKRNLGIEFGKYSLMQYRYAKEYYKIVQNELQK